MRCKMTEYTNLINEQEMFEESLNVDRILYAEKSLLTRTKEELEQYHGWVINAPTLYARMVAKNLVAQAHQRIAIYTKWEKEKC